MSRDGRSPEASALAERFGALASATVADALGGQNIVGGIDALAAAGTMAGRAYTIAMEAGDNLALHLALTRARRGDVIVAACRDPRPFGVWGGILSVAAEEAGMAGVVLDGYARDVPELREHRVAVFARGVCIRKSAKRSAGQHRIPISIGDVRVEPGDWVVGDVDGIVVVPAGDVDRVLDDAEEIVRKEGSIVRGLRDGRTTLELLGLADPGSTSGDAS